MCARAGLCVCACVREACVCVCVCMWRARMCVCSRMCVPCFVMRLSEVGIISTFAIILLKKI